MSPRISRIRLRVLGRIRGTLGLLIAALAVGLFLGACSGKTRTTAGKNTAEPPPDLITRITGGILSSRDVVLVRFAAPVVKPGQVGSVQSPCPFQFSPRIKGTARWRDAATLVFQPDNELPLRTEFTGSLDLGQINADWSERKPVPLTFSVGGREIDRLEADFYPVARRDPRFVSFRGEIVLTEPATPEQVHHALKFTRNGRSVPLDWESSSRGVRFRFHSGELERPDSRVVHVLSVAAGGLGLSADYRRDFALNPVGRFTLEEVFQRDQGQAPALELRFSDPPDPQAELAGLIRLQDVTESTPVAASPSLQVAGKSVFISGKLIYGHKYVLQVDGLHSIWGTALSRPERREVWFADQKPRVAFDSDGVFMTSLLDRKVYFRTMNVSAVKVEIKKVFESNLGQFLQTESLSSRRDRNDDFNEYNIRRVGLPVAAKRLNIGDIKNRWLTHELDLSELLPSGEMGVFLVELSFSRKDMLYSGPKPTRSNYYGREYYSNPHGGGYLYRNGRVYKALINSDIGMVYKAGAGGHLVWTLDLRTARPLKGVHVRLRSYQNQVLAEGFSDSDGEVFLEDVKGTPFFVEAEKDRQRSVVAVKEMPWNLSSFETGGVKPSADGVRAFVFTDRGVYRPGDTVHIGLIARNRDHTFPENHPVSLTLSNPRNQPVYRLTNKHSRDGFFRFDVQTRPEDLTGAWKARIQIGDRKVVHPIRIETVVPFRLKVEYSGLPERITADMDRLRFGLAAHYLFGSPAGNLPATVEARIEPRTLRLPRFSRMVFRNMGVSFRDHEQTIHDGNLDNGGEAAVAWKLPDMSNAPGGLSLKLTARVREKGGRSSSRTVALPIDPFSRYVGIEVPSGGGFSRVGAPIKFRVALVDPQGRPVSGRTMAYRIFQNSRYWWWEYDSRNEFRTRFKQDAHTRQVDSGTLSSTANAAELTFTPESHGEYFLEIRDSAPGGHTAGVFFSAYHWGEAPAELENAGVLEIHSTAKEFSPGDVAEMSVKTPVEGRLLVAVEKGNRILKRFSMSTDSGGETRFRVPVTSEMLPNAYVSVALVQPLEQGQNDRPLRMYGVVPMMVRDPETRQELDLQLPEELASGKPFVVKLQTRDHEPTQLMVAVVDEGLLSLTDFATPDPWGFFFAKEGLAVGTYDLYSQVIGVRKVDAFRMFSIGGGMAEAYRESQLQPNEKKRFPPVAMVVGPLDTDENGAASVSLQMPDYIGAVRVMAVSARENCYGSAQRTVPVRTPLMVLPTLPRLLGPEDQFTVPVTVFALEKGLRRVKVKLEAEGPVEVVPPREKEIHFSETGEKDTFFKVRVLPATGSARLSVSARSGRHRATHVAQIQVRPYSPRLSRVVRREAEPGSRLIVKIPGDGIPGTNEAQVSISSRPRLNLKHRVGWLIHYPYGCIEQTVSAAFPQLMLLDFIQAEGEDRREVDANINEAIQRLKKFLLPGGGFSFWPGGRRLSVWGTAYAGHFLVEAAKLGYHVPADLNEAWVNFQIQRSRTTTDNLMVRLYGVYGLTLAGRTPWSALNLLYESSLKDMTDVEKWMLASCYHMAGKNETVAKILTGTGTKVDRYAVPGETFGSWLRDKAVILEQASLLRRWKTADRLYDELVTELSADSWYSTQSLGYALLAVGKYIRARGEKLTGDLPLLEGTIQLPDGSRESFSARRQKFTFPVHSGFGGETRIDLSKKTESSRCYVTVEWSGIPLKPVVRPEASNLELQVRWLDSSGTPVDPRSLAQGASIWGHFRVRSTWEVGRRIKNLALVQVLPSGWEIDNLRLTGGDLPDWMRRFRLNQEDYLDIRDDRVIWFFDLYRQPLDFVVKLTAVIPGEFVLPPTLVEGMYDNRFRAVQVGGAVTVRDR